MSWTETKVKKLKELWGKGNTASQIAEIIGDMSRNAVIGKAHRLNLSSKVNNNFSSGDLNSKKNNQEFKKTNKKSRRSKFRSFLIEKNFEPARNLTLEELTEETCKYMEHDVHPNDPNATFCGRKTISNSKHKFSYCPLHLMIIFQPKSKKEDVTTKDDEVPQFIEKKIKSA
jgi:GcrA cell cycle regulator